ncbi:MAG: hypothetical protein RL711_234 [Bacteroidota bacterium]
MYGMFKHLSIINFVVPIQSIEAFSNAMQAQNHRGSCKFIHTINQPAFLWFAPNDRHYILPDTFLHKEV